MNCHDIDRLLIAGTDPSAWPAEARAHAESCTRCQDLLGLELGVPSNQPEAAGPAGAPIAVAQLVLNDLRPVKPMAGNAVLISVTIAVIVVAMSRCWRSSGRKAFR